MGGGRERGAFDGRGERAENSLKWLFPPFFLFFCGRESRAFVGRGETRAFAEMAFPSFCSSIMGDGRWEGESGEFDEMAFPSIFPLYFQPNNFLQG